MTMFLIYYAFCVFILLGADVGASAVVKWWQYLFAFIVVPMLIGKFLTHS